MKATITRAALWEALWAAAGYRYAVADPVTRRRDPRYPGPLVGFKVPLAEPLAGRIDCCTLAEWVIVSAAQRCGFGPWSSRLHALAMCTEGVWSTDAYLAAGLGTAWATSCGEPPEWSAVQGWTDDPAAEYAPGKSPNGHTFLVAAVSGTGGAAKVLSAEANRSRSLPEFGADGAVGHRGIGPLEVMGQPAAAAPGGWADRCSWTWARYCARYPYMRVVALNLAD